MWLWSAFEIRFAAAFCVESIVATKSRWMVWNSVSGRWYASLTMCNETQTLKHINKCMTNTLSRNIIYNHYRVRIFFYRRFLPSFFFRLPLLLLLRLFRLHLFYYLFDLSTELFCWKIDWAVVGVVVVAAANAICLFYFWWKWSHRLII